MDDGVNHLDDPAESRDPGRHVAIVGRSTMNAAYSIVRNRGASSWLLTWTLAGGGRLTHDEVTVAARRHDLVILGPDVRQRYGTLEAPWDFAWSHFQPRPAWRTLVRPWRAGSHLYRTHVGGVEDARRIDAAFDRALGDLRGDQTSRLTGPADLDDRPGDAGRQSIHVSGVASADLLLNAIEEILLVAARGDRAGTATPIEAADAIVRADPSAPHTVASLAAAVAMSPSHFAHRYRRHTGRSPMAAVRDERLALAVQLLRTTDLSVAQVAGAVGYADAFYFSRLFRRHLGVAPSAYAAAAVDSPRYHPPVD